MASFAPAACRPCAMDQAMLRLLATPKTTATRPSRLKDISTLRSETIKDISGWGAGQFGAEDNPILSRRSGETRVQELSHFVELRSTRTPRLRSGQAFEGWPSPTSSLVELRSTGRAGVPVPTWFVYCLSIPAGRPCALS